MNDLFDNDPAFAVAAVQKKKKRNSHSLRDMQGRFATEREARASRALYENERLKRDVEKYRRAYLSASELSSYWHRKYLELKDSNSKTS